MKDIIALIKIMQIEREKILEKKIYTSIMIGMFKMIHYY